MARFSGQRLREARSAAGIKREQLALLIDRSYYSVDLYERGLVTPPLQVACRMADVLGVAVGDLLEEVPAGVA